MKRSSFPPRLPDVGQPYTSTPNTGSSEEVNPYASSTPLRKEIVDQKKSIEQNDLEHLYAKVDKLSLRKAREAEDLSGFKDSSFVENSLYANKNLQGRFEIYEDSDKEAPPPIPERSVLSLGDLDDDANEVYDDKELGANAEPGYSTIRSTISNNHDEGYSTVDETLQRGTKVCIAWTLLKTDRPTD